MLSIIVPVYNVEEYIIECLESLDAQTYSDVEIIVVDDGSTDKSGGIVDTFCKGKDKFKVFHKSNGGLMSAWIFGVEKASGRYLGFVDSDDYVRQDMYAKLMQKAQETDADIVMCGRHDITKTSERDVVDSYDAYYGEDTIAFIHDRVFPSLKGGNISSARWNKIYKREVFIPNLIYCRDKSRYCEDRYIIPATLLTATSFAYIAEPLYVYRMRKTANSKSPSKELIPSLDRLHAIQKSMLIDKGMFDKYKHSWELAKLNYLKLAYERNLVNSRGLREKIVSASGILSKYNRQIVLANRSECVNKFGKTLFWAAKLNSRGLLLAAAFFNRLATRNVKMEWYD